MRWNKTNKSNNVKANVAVLAGKERSHIPESHSTELRAVTLITRKEALFKCRKVKLRVTEK